MGRRCGGRMEGSASSNQRRPALPGSGVWSASISSFRMAFSNLQTVSFAPLSPVVPSAPLSPVVPSAPLSPVVSSAQLSPVVSSAPLAPEVSTIEPIGPSQLECGICLDTTKDCAFNCGHMSCFECAELLQTCHICRSDITERRKVYV